MSPVKRAGVAELPLHRGRTPAWLSKRMVKLARGMCEVMVEEFGSEEILRRLSDTHWFQSLGCVLGFDWHSSGVTTVVCGVLKRALTPERHGMVVVGGKGRSSRRAPEEIEETARDLGLWEGTVEELRLASRMTAKVDNAVLQDSHQLYHHAMFLDSSGEWTVIQQGMNTAHGTARRYHWLSGSVMSYVEEPHSAIVGTLAETPTLDMTARASEDTRKTSVDLSGESSTRVRRLVDSIIPMEQKTLGPWVPGSEVEGRNSERFLSMPRRINWKALDRTYEMQPSGYQDLVATRGIGPATVRGLALISEIVYGEEPSWRDPVRYSFAFGGKDGVPYPVDRVAMDEAISFLRSALDGSDVSSSERRDALRRLGRLEVS